MLVMIHNENAVLGSPDIEFDIFGPEPIAFLQVSYVTAVTCLESAPSAAFVR
jgi:hypothetical protein